jgi:hypothetical protein
MVGDRFFAILEREAGVDRPTAVAVARATPVPAQRSTELFDSDEFVARVAARTGRIVDGNCVPSTPRRAFQAVLNTWSDLEVGPPLGVEEVEGADAARLPMTRAGLRRCRAPRRP